MDDSAPTQHLTAAGDSVRRFNHASRSAGDSWAWPGDSYTALGALAHLAHGLPQAIEQAVRPAMRVYEHGCLAVDGGDDPDAAVRRLRAALDGAVRSALALGAALDSAHAETSAMGVDITGLTPDDG